MKKYYFSPEIETKKLPINDILCTSGTFPDKSEENDVDISIDEMY